MTPELRHGLYAVDPKDLGGDKYEAEREQDRENEKTRSVTPSLVVLVVDGF